MNTFTDLDKSKLSYFHLDDLKAGNLGSAGPPGPVGPAGPIGPAGFNGTNGVDGADGINGVDGIDGPPGPQGPVGTTGPQGIQGVQGIQGNDGPPGADGNDGLNGVDGATGATGPQGPQGPQGVQGIQGDDGVDGYPGPQGPAGPSGAAAVFIELVSQPLGYITFPTSTQLLTGTYFAVDQYATDGISFSGGAISVAQSGYYRVDVSLYVTGTGGQQRFYLDRRLNAGLGSFDTKGVYHVTGAGDQVYQFSTTVYLEATGAVTLRAVDLEPMANPVTVFFGGDHTKVTVTKVDGIQGLQGIQGPAGTFIPAFFSLTGTGGSQALAHGMNFLGQQWFDAGGVINIGNAFTWNMFNTHDVVCVTPGVYLVQFTFYLDSTDAWGKRIILRRNLSTEQVWHRDSSPAAAVGTYNLSKVMYLGVGDSLTLLDDSGVGYGVGMVHFASAHTYFHIARMG